MRSVKLPQSAIVGEERDIYSPLSVTSTINLSTYLKKGQIVLRSKSLVKLLLANESHLLTELASRHRVQVKVNLSKVKYLSNVQWVYYEALQTHHFKEYHSMQLEAAYQNGSPDFAFTPEVHVYFPLMLQIAQDRYGQIDRYERVTSSTDAALVVVETLGEGLDAMSAEVQSYESSVELGDRTYCRNLLSCLQKHGLGVIQGKVYGTNSDLAQAFEEMDQVLAQQRQTIACYPMPVGVDISAISEIAAQLGVQIALFDVRVFGTEQTLATLMQQIYSLYESVPIPSNVTRATLTSLCSKHGLTQQGQYLFGLKEKVVLALADLAESSVPIPAGATESQINEVIQRFGVRREGGMLLGARDEVNGAFQALEHADQSAALPKHLRVPGEDNHTVFLQLDFGIRRDANAMIKIIIDFKLAVDLGPLIRASQQQRVWDFLSDAQVAGIAVVAQGQIVEHAPDSGFYQAPTLLRDVPPEHRLAQEEIFGPVLCAMPFHDEDHAVQLANGTAYGLVAGLWTRDGARQLRLARRLRCGQVFVNNYGAGGGVELPFGGVKSSGHGREKGFEALYGFTTLKTVAIRHG